MERAVDQNGYCTDPPKGTYCHTTGPSERGDQA